VASSSNFEGLFRTSNGRRDKFLAKVFSTFSEDIIRLWCASPQSLYEDLGRPTIKRIDGSGGKRFTLDFTFRSKNDGHIYVGEMKCELEYQGYKFLTLESPEQLKHHSKDAFLTFLDMARSPRDYSVTVNGRPQSIDGSILVWGRATAGGRSSVMKTFGLSTILTVEEVIIDLLTWESKEFLEYVDEREKWCRELFDGLRNLKAD
jgi:hypothetical protein